MFKALADCHIDQHYSTILGHIYEQAIASIRLHEETSPIRVERGVIKET